MLAEHSHRDIHLPNPMWQVCVEDLKVPIVLVRRVISYAALKHSLRIMSINSLPRACVSLMTWDIIVLSMSPRRSSLPICSDASNPGSLITTPFLARIELNMPLLCVPRSQRTSLGQPAQRVQPCTKARKHACDDGETKLSDSRNPCLITRCSHTYSVQD